MKTYNRAGCQNPFKVIKVERNNLFQMLAATTLQSIHTDDPDLINICILTFKF